MSTLFTISAPFAFLCGFALFSFGVIVGICAVAFAKANGPDSGEDDNDKINFRGFI